MIRLIISNCRPFWQSKSYAKLQRTALESWKAIAKETLLCNLPKDVGDIYSCHPSLIQPPPISFIVQTALERTTEDDVFAIVNADIILDPVMGRWEPLSGTWALVSKRMTYDPANGLEGAYYDPNDNGLDFFCAPRRVWKTMLVELPPVLTLGRTHWDNWVNGWLNINVANYYDITRWGAVRHPIHERSPLINYSLSPKLSATFILPSGGGMPMNKLARPS